MTRQLRGYNTVISFLAFLLFLFLVATTGRAMDNPRIRIESIENGQPGTKREISIMIENCPLQMGGFDFKIAFDASGLTIDSVTAGDLITSCEWEYFGFTRLTKQPDKKSLDIIRILAFAEIFGGSNPACFGSGDTSPRELARIHATILESAPAECPLSFYWDMCPDNLISDVTGEFAYLDVAVFDANGYLFWDELDDQMFPEESRPGYVGTPDSCESMGEKMMCGDVNGDGTVSIGDGVYLVNYLFKTGPPPHPWEAGDVNNDDVINLGDAVHLIHFVFHGGPSPDCDGLIRFIEFQNGCIRTTG